MGMLAIDHLKGG